MKSIIFAYLSALSLCFGGTSGIVFVYQPLTPMGTDADPRIVVAKIPVIINANYESHLQWIAAPNKLLQAQQTPVEDSNLLSCWGISIDAEIRDGEDASLIRLDLTKMKSPPGYGLDDESVVSAAVECIQRTIDEIGQGLAWELKIASKPGEAAKWGKFEKEYRAKSPPNAEAAPSEGDKPSSAKEELALFAIHPNSQAYQFEEPDDFDQKIKGYTRLKRSGDRELFVSVDPYFKITSVKSANIGIFSSGHRSVMIEFSKDRIEDLRKLRLNQVTGRFAVLNRRREILGIVDTGSIGVETHRFGVPVDDMTEAQKLIEMLQPAITKPPGEGE